MQKNEIYEGIIEGYTSEGLGVLKVDGRVVFVKNSVKGDKLLVKIVKVNKKIAFGIIDKILIPSSQRIEPECKISNVCGGCELFHMTYEEELNLKKEKVSDCLRKIGKVEIPNLEIFGSDIITRYRNKAQFPVSFDGKNVISGFYRQNSHDVVPTKDCLIQTTLSNEISNFLCEFFSKNNIKPYNETTHTGLIRHIYIRTGFITNELMVCLVTTKFNIKNLDVLEKELKERFKSIKSFVLNKNAEKTNQILGSEYKVIYGDGNLSDYLCDNKFLISPPAFFQINRKSAENLYKKAIEFSDFKGNERVLDMYCGAGTITLAVSKYVSQITGIEIIPEAIENAKFNASENNITNADFIVGDAKDAVKRFENEKIDVVLVDPPRKGLDNDTIFSIIKINPLKITYVSCDPATLARDVKIFTENGYKVEKACAFDLFPRTKHIETVCLLSKLNVDHHIEVELNMDELDLTSAESKATYAEIKDYVLKNSGLKVSSLYIAQVKDKMGIKERENFNLSKKDDAKVPVCPADKEKAIIEALEHFNMID